MKVNKKTSMKTKVVRTTAAKLESKIAILAFDLYLCQ